MRFQPAKPKARDCFSSILSLAVAAALAFGVFLGALPRAEAAGTGGGIDYAELWNDTVNDFSWTDLGAASGLMVWNGDNFGSNDEIDEPFCNALPSEATLARLYELRTLRETDYSAYAAQARSYENDTVTKPGWNTNRTNAYGVTWNTLDEDASKRVGPRIEPSATPSMQASAGATLTEVEGSVEWYADQKGGTPARKTVNLYCYTPEQFRWAMKEMEKQPYNTIYGNPDFSTLLGDETDSPIISLLGGNLIASGLDTRVNVFLMADFDMGGEKGNVWFPINQALTTLNIFSLPGEAKYDPAQRGFTVGGKLWRAAPDADLLLENQVGGRNPDEMEPRTIYNLDIVNPALFRFTNECANTGLVRRTSQRGNKYNLPQSLGMAFCNIAFRGLRIDASSGDKGGGTGLVGLVGAELYGGFHMNNIRVDSALIATPKNANAFISAASGVLCGRSDGYSIETPKSFRFCSLSDVRSLGNMHNGTLSGVIDYATFENCYSVGGLVLSANPNGHSGGLVSCANAGMIFRQCFVSAEVYGMNSSGGFIGDCQGESIFEHCYSTGFVEGTQKMGGFIGNAGGQSGDIVFTDCYTTMMVGMENDAVDLGGFVGSVLPNSRNGQKIAFQSCYAAGEVGTLNNRYSEFYTGGDKKNITSGGFVGLLQNCDNTNVEFERCLYDMQTTAMFNRPIGELMNCRITKYDGGGNPDGYLTNADLLPDIMVVFPGLGNPVDDTYFEITKHLDLKKDVTTPGSTYHSPVHIHGLTTTGLTFGGLSSEVLMDSYAQSAIYEAYELGNSGVTGTWEKKDSYQFRIDHLWDFDKYDADGNLIPPIPTTDPGYAGSDYAKAKRHWAYRLENKGLYPQLLSFYEPNGFLERDKATIKAYSAASVTTVFVNDWEKRQPTDYTQESFGSVQSIVSYPAFSSAASPEQFRKTSMGSYAAVTNPNYRIVWSLDTEHQSRANLSAKSPVFGKQAMEDGTAPDILTLSPTSEVPAPGPVIQPSAPNTSSASVVFELRNQGAPVGGVSYSLYDQEGFRMSTVVSDQNGRVVFNGLQNLASDTSRNYFTIQESSSHPNRYMENSREWRVATTSGAAVSVTIMQRAAGANNWLPSGSDGTPSDPLEVNYLPKTAYEADAIYPGIQWVKADVTYGDGANAVTAHRYLRLAFTSYFDVGGDVLIGMDKEGGFTGSLVDGKPVTTTEAVKAILSKASFGFGTPNALKLVNDDPDLAPDFRVNLEDARTIFIDNSERGPVSYQKYDTASPTNNPDPNPTFLNRDTVSPSRLGTYTTTFGPISFAGMPDFFQHTMGYNDGTGMVTTVWNTMEVSFQRQVKDPATGNISYVDMWETLDDTLYPTDAAKLEYVRMGRRMLLGEIPITKDLVGNYKILFRWTLFDGRTVEQTKLVSVTTTTDFSFQKTDMEGNPLEGARFELQDPVSGQPLQSTVSGTDGIVRFDGLSKGIYYMTESQAPVGYEGMKQKTWTLSVENSAVTGKLDVFLYGPDGVEVSKDAGGSTYQVKNNPIKVDFAFQKTNEDKTAPLGGATGAYQVQFELREQNGALYRESEPVGADGAVHFRDVSVGTYSLVETNTQLGYQTSSDAWKVTVKERNPGSPQTGADQVEIWFEGWGFPAGGARLTTNDAASVQIANEELKTDLKLWKTGGRDRWPLSGAVFELYDAHGGLLATAVSAGDGSVTFPRVRKGSYVLKETKAPSGYMFYKGQSTWPVEIRTDSVNNVLVSKIDGINADRFYVNNPEIVHPTDYTELVIWKKNEQGYGLPGAVFGLFEGDKEIYRAVSDSKGRAEIRINIPYYSETNRYVLKELKAPEGYIATKETWEVYVPEEYKIEVLDQNGAPASKLAGWLTVVNKRALPEPSENPSPSPQTGDFQSGKLLGGTLILAGGLYIFRQSFRLRKRRSMHLKRLRR